MGAAKELKDEQNTRPIGRFRLLTEEQVAGYLGVAVATLRNMRSKPGRDPIPFTKIGGAIRYREDLLMKWIERNTFESVDQYR